MGGGFVLQQSPSSLKKEVINVTQLKHSGGDELSDDIDG